LIHSLPKQVNNTFPLYLKAKQLYNEELLNVPEYLKKKEEKKEKNVLAKWVDRFGYVRFLVEWCREVGDDGFATCNSTSTSSVGGIGEVATLCVDVGREVDFNDAEDVWRWIDCGGGGGEKEIVIDLTAD